MNHSCQRENVSIFQCFEAVETHVSKLWKHRKPLNKARKLTKKNAISTTRMFFFAILPYWVICIQTRLVLKTCPSLWTSKPLCFSLHISNFQFIHYSAGTYLLSILTVAVLKLKGSGVKRRGLGSCNGSHENWQLSLMSQDNSRNERREWNRTNWKDDGVPWLEKSAE